MHVDETMQAVNMYNIGADPLDLFLFPAYDCVLEGGGGGYGSGGAEGGAGALGLRDVFNAAREWYARWWQSDEAADYARGVLMRCRQLFAELDKLGMPSRHVSRLSKEFVVDGEGSADQVCVCALGGMCWARSGVGVVCAELSCQPFHQIYLHTKNHPTNNQANSTHANTKRTACRLPKRCRSRPSLHTPST